MTEKTVYDPEYVRALSKSVYMKQLNKFDRKFFRDKAGDDFERQLNVRAQAYDGLTRTYLDAIREYGVRKQGGEA